MSVTSCTQLVSLLRDDTLDVTETVTHLLCALTESSDGAQDALNASILEYVAELLESPKAAATSDDDPVVITGAAYAFSQITQWPEGAEAALNAEMPDYMDELLESPNPQVRGWTQEAVVGRRKMWRATRFVRRAATGGHLREGAALDQKPNLA
ncbi:hypothetical protein DFH09DRAFT_1293599 [Mycena vulgaris]|nr:hypothetical protein DFH09DRAFT_1293599 [Mycena vulgaris]